MTIDGVNVAEFGARFLGFENAAQTITNNLFLPETTGTPHLLSQTMGQKVVTFKFALQSTAKDTAYQQYSRLVAALSKNTAVTLKPKDSVFSYTGYYAGSAVYARRRGTVWAVEVQMTVVQTTDRQTLTIEPNYETGQTIITLDSTAPTPVVLKLDLRQENELNTPSYVLNFGIGDTQYYFRNLRLSTDSKQPVYNVIDGETGTVRYDSAAEEYAGSYLNAIQNYEAIRQVDIGFGNGKTLVGIDFPVLLPGENILSYVGPAYGWDADLTLSFAPRWL